ncbi:[Fe-Fe] hydrogenase large subunit C-terminal domain-containing protein [Eubacteriaceae bacterium ES2]|nr:[Fe-Fe] hydrogenase large subunit C-terminal domain-containing protein [Eubacteriaceae bacterium ES2]
MGIIDFSKEKCRNCYKCIRICPVKAIKLKDKHAQIISDMCIGCGYCIKICPQNAKEIQSDVSLVKDWLKESTVVVSLSGVFPASSDMKHPRQYLGALRKLGFSIIEDVSVGMEAVALENEKEFMSDRQFVINSSCPAVKNLIEQYYPDYVKYLSRVISPTIAHGRMLKERYPNSKIVVIGACLAEKTEIADTEVAGVIDAVITFDEIRQWFRDEGVEPNESPIEEFDAVGSNQLNNWPMSEGLTEKDALKLEADRNIISIEGIENSMAFLNEIGRLKKNTGYRCGLVRKVA